MTKIKEAMLLVLAFTLAVSLICMTAKPAKAETSPRQIENQPASQAFL